MYFSHNTKKPALDTNCNSFTLFLQMMQNEQLSAMFQPRPLDVNYFLIWVCYLPINAFFELFKAMGQKTANLKKALKNQ